MLAPVHPLDVEQEARVWDPAQNLSCIDDIIMRLNGRTTCCRSLAGPSVTCTQVVTSSPALLGPVRKGPVDDKDGNDRQKPVEADVMEAPPGIRGPDEAVTIFVKVSNMTLRIHRCLILFSTMSKWIRLSCMLLEI